MVAETAQKIQESAPSAAAQAAWTRVLGHLKGEVGDTAFRSWLRPMAIQRAADGQAVLAAPTRFLRDWVVTHYADRLLTLWRSEDPRVTSVAIVVAEEAAGKPAAV